MASVSDGKTPKSSLESAEITQILTRDKFGSRTWFTGGTYLDNGHLLMADCSSNQLIQLNSEYIIINEHKIGGTPTDVAAGNKDNEIYIAVSDYSQNYIYVCTLDTDLTIVRRIRAPLRTCGIAVIGDNIIVGTPDAVVILAQDGSAERSIPKSGAYYSYVAVSQTQRTIYHRDNNDVVCQTWEGKEVFRYRHQQLEVPGGMYVDRRGFLYICGMYSHNVHQVSPNGERSRVIQLQNINQPWSVVLHPQKNQLLITSWNEKTVCEIYKLG